MANNEQPHLLFSQKMNLSKKYEAWCRENGVQDCALSLIGFLQIKGLLNTAAIFEFLSKKEANNESE